VSAHTITEETDAKLLFMTSIISAFADACEMKSQEAYMHLKKHGGMDFINEHWRDLNAKNVTDALREICGVCRKNGSTANPPFMNKKTVEEETDDKINFMPFIIQKFARAYKMGSQQAYLYLKKHGGLDYLSECWWALHTDNPYWAIRDMYHMCLHNGGMR